MSFQTYLANIQAKTGKSATDFRVLAEQKGLAHGGELREGVKAGSVVECSRAISRWATGTRWRSMRC